MSLAQYKYKTISPRGIDTVHIEYPRLDGRGVVALVVAAFIA